MIKNENKINGYILAGGKSSRMGSDKGMLYLNGKYLIEFVIDQIKPAVKKLIIVSNNPDYSRFGLPVIPDLIMDAGPAGGIHSALSHTDEKMNLIVSCDMPFINSNTINFLIENSFNCQIIMTEHNNRKEPLFALYSKECLSQWELLIQNGILKLQELVMNFNPKILNIENNDHFQSNHFANINSPGDLGIFG